MRLSTDCFAFAVFTLAALGACFPAEEAAAQCAVCPTVTPVVAYQPVVQPVVVPTTPAAISGWYPGKLLDTWAANRAAYRAATLGTVTTAYRPVTSALPVTAFQPITTTTFQTSLMPITTYRPVFAQPLVATTAYSPVVTAYSPIVTSYSPVTAYNPVVATPSVCCDPCSAAAVTSYAPTSAACCVAATGATFDGGSIVTPIPELGNEVRGYQQSQRPETGGGSSAGGNNQPERSLLDEQQRQQQQQQQESRGTEGASFEAPPLKFPPQDLPAAASDPTARVDRTQATPAVYSEPVRPILAASGQAAPATKPLPSRAERDAGWTAAAR